MSAKHGAELKPLQLDYRFQASGCGLCLDPIHENESNWKVLRYKMYSMWMTNHPKSPFIDSRKRCRKTLSVDSIWNKTRASSASYHQLSGPLNLCLLKQPLLWCWAIYNTTYTVLSKGAYLWQPAMMLLSRCLLVHKWDCKVIFFLNEEMTLEKQDNDILPNH